MSFTGWQQAAQWFVWKLPMDTTSCHLHGQQCASGQLCHFFMNPLRKNNNSLWNNFIITLSFEDFIKANKTKLLLVHDIEGDLKKKEKKYSLWVLLLQTFLKWSSSSCVSLSFTTASLVTLLWVGQSPQFPWTHPAIPARVHTVPSTSPV